MKSLLRFRPWLSASCGFAMLALVLRAAPAGAEAVVVLMGDQHSAYERTAQFVAFVDRLKKENPTLPLAVLLNGDTLEHGNLIARRSHGEIDFAMFTALAQRATTILNVGNHEPEFYDVAETVKRIEATGVRVVTNLVNRATGEPFAPASTTLTLGAHQFVVIGVTTDALATYRVAVRPSLDLANPVVWAKANFPKLLTVGRVVPDEPSPATEKISEVERVAPNALKNSETNPIPVGDKNAEAAATQRTEVSALHPEPGAATTDKKTPARLSGDASPYPPLAIILSHAGVAADREMLPLVPAGTLFAGAHNHLRFIEPFGLTIYVHSGSWNEYASVAWLYRDADGAPRWTVEQVKIPDTEPRDDTLAALIREVRELHLEPADRVVVGQLREAKSTAEAARYVARALRETASVDAAFIGNTTFGAGLPRGEITQAEFDACVRFDGTIFTTQVDGGRLAQLLAAANQGPDTPFAERRGEFCFADGPSPAAIVATKRYTIATTDWGAKNSARYFGEPALTWTERADLKLKPIVRARFARDRVAEFPEPTEETELPSAEALFALGQQLFDAYAPEEIKAEYEFPSKQDWDEFARRLQAALESNDLSRLAAYEPEARAALLALRAIPEYADYANWLEERLDYIEAAKKSLERRPTRPTRPVVTKPAPGPTTPTTPAPGPAPSPTPTKPYPTPPLPPVVTKPTPPTSTTPPPTSAPAPTAPGAAQIPNYAVWLERMRTRQVPTSAGRLLPRVQEVFVEEGVPAELAWMAEAESTFNPAARSPVGAKGLFQLMPETAKSLGLQTFLPDERSHPEKSARAAAQYLRQLHGRFGSWPLALAAYNGGQGRVSRTLKKQNATTFEEIADALPAETRMYVPKVLATIEVRAGIAPEKIRAPRVM